MTDKKEMYAWFSTIQKNNILDPIRLQHCKYSKLHTNIYLTENGGKGKHKWLISALNKDKSIINEILEEINYAWDKESSRRRKPKIYKK